MPYTPASTILAGIKVLDLTRVRAGPTCVRQLADWGADVIKVEAPEHAGQSSLGGPRSGPDFQNLHRNKRSMTLDLKTSEGVEVFRRLADTADVVVENYRADVKRRLGIDYAALSARNPRLIYASISGFGQDGPDADRPGFDQIAQGMGGLMSITGEPGRGPMRVGIPIADLCAGIFAAQGVLLALIDRQRSGKGQWVQSSLLQAQLFMLDFQAARWLMDGEVPGQAGNNHPTSIPTGVFETADGYLNLAVAGQAMWLKLKDLLADPRLDDADFADGGRRSVHRDRLNAILGDITRQKTSAEWIAAFNAAGVPAGEINTIDRAFESAQVKHLGIARDCVSQERGQTRMVGQPIIMSGAKSEIVTPPPLMGQHTQEVLAEAGFSATEIAALKEKDVV
ncbi:MAG: CoA transferase [Hyphomicrobiaceae bacterium]